MQIRALDRSRADEAIALWQACGLTRPWNDPRADLDRALDGPASTILAAIEGESLVGTAMVGHDGHRGWVYYLASDPRHRGQGIGRALMQATESWLIERGVPKVHFMVRTSNTSVLDFYARLGYEEQDCVVLGRRLDGVPSGSARQRSAAHQQNTPPTTGRTPKRGGGRARTAGGKAVITKYTAAQVVGLALVVLAVIIWLAWLIRGRVKVLQRLYVPTCVIGGFTMLLLGPQVLGALTGTGGLFPQGLIDVWRVLPGILINIVFGAIMIGKRLPSLREVWSLSAPHFIFGSLLSLGQFALGAFAVLFILQPVFHVSPLAGAIIEMAFAGGHGTVGGMGPLLTTLGASELIDVGLGLATVSIITGIVLGTALVSYAMRSPRISVIRESPMADSLGADLGTVDEREPEEVDEEELGISQITAAFMYISLAILIALGILESLRFIFGLMGSDIFDSFPLFPLTVVGGFIVQLLITKFGVEASVDKKAVQGIATFALDMLVVAAIGTMSLATLGANLPALLIFTLIGAGWSVVALLWIAPRIHGENWFEHGLADFGQSQGNVATGFVLADMADPKRASKAATAYGYKQLTYEPLFGGGLITAMAVPFIASSGLLAFGIGSAVLTVALIAWGVLRKRRA